MVAWLCAIEQEDINVERVLKMALIHDLPEIHAGDTYFCDTNANASKKERENLAREKFLACLPEKSHKEFISAWEEFEEGITKESRLVHQCDKLIPVIEIFLNGKESYKIMKTTKKMTLEKKLSQITDEFWLKTVLLEYIDRLEKDWLFPEE